MCKIISAEPKFPNNEIIELFLANNHGFYSGKSSKIVNFIMVLVVP